jgi:GxxExxY protein
MRRSRNFEAGAGMNKPQRHGNTEFQNLNVLTSQIIACAIEVHRHLGPGLLEHLYESALCIEFEDAGMQYLRQLRVPARYKGRVLGEYRVDLVVGDAVIVEVKSVAQRNPVFEAQLLTYLRLTGKRIGLILNFNTKLLKDGIQRMIL